MGLLSTVGGFFKGLFGGGSSASKNRSTSNYNYEPDKVKVAEIEANAKLRLASMDHERIELMKNAELELLEFNATSQIAIEEAKARGFNVMAQSIVLMQERLNEIAEQRLQIIEKGSMIIVKEIENFYKELTHEIKEDDYEYNTEKLPKLLSILDKFEIGSPSHDLYKKKIDLDIDNQFGQLNSQITSVFERQKMMLGSFIQSKERIIEQTSEITQGVLEQFKNNSLGINEVNAITDGGNRKLIEE
jgi:hypothetical protein